MGKQSCNPCERAKVCQKVLGRKYWRKYIFYVCSSKNKKEKGEFDFLRTAVKNDLVVVICELERHVLALCLLIMV